MEQSLEDVARRHFAGAPKKHSQIIEALLLGQSKPEGVKVSEHFADVIEAGPQALSTRSREDHIKSDLDQRSRSDK